MPNRRGRGPRLPPRWFIRLTWFAHRALFRVTRGRVGLWRPRTGKSGTLRLTTIGRRTGRDRRELIGTVCPCCSAPSRAAAMERRLRPPIAERLPRPDPRKTHACTGRLVSG